MHGQATVLRGRPMQDPGLSALAENIYKQVRSPWVSLWSVSKLAYAIDKIPLFNGTSTSLKVCFPAILFLLECRLNCWKSDAKKDLVWETY